MTPNQYAVEIVLPTVREFLADRGNQRRAVLACITVYHTVDYLAHSQVPRNLSKPAAKRAREERAQKIRETIAGICAPSLAVVQGICNGTKHANPNQPRDVPQFSLDVEGAGFDQGRLGTPGLAVGHKGEVLFIDWCVQSVMLTLRALHGTELDPIDLTFFDPAFRGQLGWQEPPESPTKPRRIRRQSGKSSSCPANK